MTTKPGFKQNMTQINAFSFAFNLPLLYKLRVILKGAAIFVIMYIKQIKGFDYQSVQISIKIRCKIRKI